MAEWTVISVDKDETGILGATYVMKVPGGMVVRNLTATGATSLLFVPDRTNDQLVSSGIEAENLLEKWISDNKV